MVKLKKLVANTLIETIVGTVLITIIMSIALISLSNINMKLIQIQNTELKQHVKFLEYKYINQKIELPYSENFERWKIDMEMVNNAMQISISEK